MKVNNNKGSKVNMDGLSNIKWWKIKTRKACRFSLNVLNEKNEYVLKFLDSPMLFILSMLYIIPDNKRLICIWGTYHFKYHQVHFVKIMLNYQIYNIWKKIPTSYYLFKNFIKVKWLTFLPDRVPYLPYMEVICIC